MSLGDLQAIASPSPPPAAAPVVCGLPSAPKLRLAVRTAAAMSAGRSLGPSVPSVPAASSLGFLALGDLEATALQPPPRRLCVAFSPHLSLGWASEQPRLNPLIDRTAPQGAAIAHTTRSTRGGVLQNHGTRRIRVALTLAERKGSLLLPTKTHLGLRRDCTRNHASRRIANPTRLCRHSLLGCRRRLLKRPARSRWWPR